MQATTAANEYAMIRERDDALEALAKVRGELHGATVVIPTHNDAGVLHRAHASVVEQTVRPYEVLVIDDGSDIPAPNPIPLQNGVPTRVIRVTNRGLPAARNTGIMLAKTEAIVFLDADDWLEPTYLEKTLPLLFDGADVVLTGLQEHGPHRNGVYNPGFDRRWEDVTWELLINDYNRFFYCNSAEAPVWMADLGFKPIGDILPGDEVVGWIRQVGGRPKLVTSLVQAVYRRTAPLVRVVLDSGRELRCTPDHWWSSPQMYDKDGRAVNSRGGVRLGDGDKYAQAAPQRYLASVVEPVSYALQGEDLRAASWLGGMYDGEGTGANIMQSPVSNPEVCERLREALRRLGIPFVENGNIGPGRCIAFRIIGGKQAVVDFIAKTQPVRRQPLKKVVLRTKFRTPDRVASVHPDGEGEVVALQTGTGNYTAWGFGSKNCALFRAEMLREVGGYHPAMAGWPGVAGGYEDWDLWIDLLRRRVKFAAVNEPLLHYNTATPNSMLARAERNREALVAEMRRHHRL